MRRHTTLFAVPVLAALVLASCSSGGGSAPAGPVSSGSFDPAAASKAITALGTITTRGRATAGGPEQRVRTTIDYAENTMVGQFPPGVPTLPVQLQYRAESDTAWFRRGPGTQIGLGPGLLVQHYPGKPPWVAVPRTSSYAGLVMRMWDPAWLLGDIAELPEEIGTVRFRPRPEAEIGGRTLRVFAARLAPRQQGYLGIKDVKVWVDAQGVPVRIFVTTQPNTRDTYDIAKHSAKLTVDSPPASAIETANTPLPTASGPYTEVAAGTAGTVAYRVLRAPATDGGTCWKVESDPAYTPQDEPREDGGVCIPPITATGDPFDQIGFPIDETGDAPYELFGLLLPAGATAEAVFFGGTQAPVTVSDGLALVAGPAQPVLGVVEVTLPDGVRMECAPGLIQTTDDLGDANPNEARRDPWNCLPAD